MLVVYSSRVPSDDSSMFTDVTSDVTYMNSVDSVSSLTNVDVEDKLIKCTRKYLKY